MRLVVVAGVALGLGAGVAASAAPDRVDDLHRPLHFPHLHAHTKCPLTSAAHIAGHSESLTGRAPVYLIGVGGARTATIDIGASLRDSRGWYGQKTPWAIERSYDGPILVRGTRLDRRGGVRFAYGHGDHLHELSWPTGADQGSPPDPQVRFLASATLVRSPGCFGFQIDGTSFSHIIVVRIRR